MEETLATADRVAKRRARLSIVLGLLLIIQQGIFFRDGGMESAMVDNARNVDLMRMTGWFIWVIMVSILLATGGGWLQKAEVRRLINDESTRAHRNSALAMGFWAMAISAIGLYLLSMFEPVGEQMPLHIVLTFGLASALIRFGKLEKAALGE